VIVNLQTTAPFNGIIIVSKFAYGTRTLQVEVKLITYKNYT